MISKVHSLHPETLLEESVLHLLTFISVQNHTVIKPFLCNIQILPNWSPKEECISLQIY
jgi:hypothetical protein